MEELEELKKDLPPALLDLTPVISTQPNPKKELKDVKKLESDLDTE